MTLKEFIADLEERFPPGETTEANIAITGEPYVTLASGGVIEDGQPHPLLCDSEERAWAYFFDAVESYAHEKKGRLYWREKPAMQPFQMTMTDLRAQHRVVTDRYAVKARLLISDKGPA